MRGVCPLLQVYDMPARVRFYRDTLGFELVSTSPNLGGEDKFHWCLLRLCGSEVMLNDIYEFDDDRPVPPDPARVAAHHFRDPDGYGLCFHWSAERADAAASER